MSIDIDRSIDPMTLAMSESLTFLLQVSLTCEVDSNPPPTYTWTKGDSRQVYNQKTETKTNKRQRQRQSQDSNLSSTYTWTKGYSLQISVFIILHKSSVQISGCRLLAKLDCDCLKEERGGGACHHHHLHHCHHLRHHCHHLRHHHLQPPHCNHQQLQYMCHSMTDGFPIAVITVVIVIIIITSIIIVIIITIIIVIIIIIATLTTHCLQYLCHSMTDGFPLLSSKPAKILLQGPPVIQSPQVGGWWR